HEGAAERVPSRRGDGELVHVARHARLLSRDAPRSPWLLAEVDVSLSRGTLPPGAVAFAPEAEVDLRAPDAQTAERQVGKPPRKLGIDVEPPARCIGPQAENRLQEVEDAPRRPGLRRARSRVEHREGPPGPLRSGIELGEAIADKVAGRLGHVPEHPAGFRRESVALEPQRDDAVIVRP